MRRRVQERGNGHHLCLRVLLRERQSAYIFPPAYMYAYECIHVCARSVTHSICFIFSLTYAHKRYWMMLRYWWIIKRHMQSLRATQETCQMRRSQRELTARNTAQLPQRNAKVSSSTLLDPLLPLTACNISRSTWYEYIHIYTYVCIFIHICIHTHIHTYVYVYICIHATSHSKMPCKSAAKAHRRMMWHSKRNSWQQLSVSKIGSCSGSLLFARLYTSSRAIKTQSLRCTPLQPSPVAARAARATALEYMAP